MMTTASRHYRKHSLLRHSSLKRPMKLSSAPFCQGSSGSIKTTSIFGSRIEFKLLAEELRNERFEPTVPSQHGELGQLTLT